MNKLLLVLILSLSSILSFSQKVNFGKIKDEQIVKHKAFTLSYNESCEQPNWVYYFITKEQVSKYKRQDNFRSDTSIKSGSATPNDYSRSGYDRGHLANASDLSYDSIALSESFFMSNMSPQKPGFNRGIWKSLEDSTRKLLVDADTIFIITGGQLNGDLRIIGESGVCVPNFYYKILIIKKGKKKGVLAFYMPNEKSDKSLKSFMVKPSFIEKKVGFNILD